MDISLTVIIPVYNVAPYLRGCLESVVVAVREVSEGISDFTAEVLCIDDGSTDGSGDILDEYANRLNHQRGDGRSSLLFHSVHQKNRGVSMARNAALDMARGKWVMMLDGDDQWTSDLLVRLFDQIKLHPDCDAVAFGIVTMDESGRETGRFGSAGCSAVTTGDAVLADGRGPMSKFIWSSCDKIYRRSVIEKIPLRYEKGMRVCEDSLFAQIFFSCAGKVVLQPEIKGYRYLMRSGSAIHVKDTALSEDPLRMFRVLHAQWEKIKSRGMLRRLQLVAAALPSLGKEENYSDTVRGQAIEWLLQSREFKRFVIPFMVKHGTLKSRFFSIAYYMLPNSGKRWVLEKI